MRRRYDTPRGEAAYALKIPRGPLSSNHSYVTHSNKALRPLNMHLNVRQARPTITSILSYLQPLLPFSLYPETDTSTVTPPLRSPRSMLANGIGKGKPAGLTGGADTRRPSATIMAQIPPTTNPRGELIFSGRVDRAFREGYERYRAAFERRRVEKEREHNRMRWGKLGAWWYGPSPPPVRQAPVHEAADGRASPTPPASRKATPEPSFDALASDPMRTLGSVSPAADSRENIALQT